MRKRLKPSVVIITNLQRRVQLSYPTLTRLTRQILRKLNQSVECHLVFVTDQKIRTVNRQFHGTDRATDVLAFEKPAKWPRVKHSSKRILGDIIISIDRAYVYAKRYSVTPQEEVLRYIIHGILHLLGERDHTKRLRDRMFQKQESLLRSLDNSYRLFC